MAASKDLPFDLVECVVKNLNLRKGDYTNAQSIPITSNINTLSRTAGRFG